MGEISFEKLREYTDTGLRGYQNDHKRHIYSIWQTKKSVMLQMPTGTGKTRLFSSLIKDLQVYAERHSRVVKCLIMVHRTELIDQIVNELYSKYNLETGIIQAGHRQKPELPLQVASVQTLFRRLEKWSSTEFDFIIVDEAHHVQANSYLEIINTFSTAKLLGVTATPYRLSGEGFADIFDELIISPSVGEFIEMGVLCKYDYYSVRENSEIYRDISHIKKLQHGDYDEREMSSLCDNDHIRAQVVETYLKYASGKKGIVYTINRQHNQNLCDAFAKHGIKAVAIDSLTPSEIRAEYISNFKDGKIDIICNVNIFSEGFDCPDIEFIQLARPTKSLSMYLQQVGRGLRSAPNKERCIFLDNVGLYNRFGLPAVKRKWMQHFLGADVIEEIHKGESRLMECYSETDLSEGNENVYLIETLSELKYEKQRAEQLFPIVKEFNELLIERDDQAISILETEFSEKNECLLCFDGNEVKVWKDNQDDSKHWKPEFYLKNFKFRFEGEPEWHYLDSEEDLNKWLTFRFKAIRRDILQQEYIFYWKDLGAFSLDKGYFVDLYTRWFDNSTNKPNNDSPMLRQLASQTYDFLIERSSGNRVFKLFMDMPENERRQYFAANRL